MQLQLFGLRLNCTDVLQETKLQSQSNKFFSNWNFLFWRLSSNYGTERQCYLVLYTTPGLEEFYNTWLHDKGVLLTVKLLKAVTVLHTLRVNFVAFSSRSYQQKRERERKKRGNKIRGQFFLKLYRTREEKEQWKHFCGWGVYWLESGDTICIIVHEQRYNILWYTQYYRHDNNTVYQYFPTLHSNTNVSWKCEKYLCGFQYIR